MDNQTFRTPKKEDRVGAIGRDGIFSVVEVHTDPNLVDIRPLKGGPIETGVPWAALMFTDQGDASQAAVRIVTEATTD